jgi:ubiquinol-cytochrome c reductase cytochrome b subunit
VEAGLPGQKTADASEATLIAEGRQLLVDEMACTECHQFRKPDDTVTAPDLTGYGSRDWLLAFLHSPKHERFYGDRNDRMPAYGEDGVLDEKSIGLLADWLRGEWYEPHVIR